MRVSTDTPSRAPILGVLVNPSAGHRVMDEEQASANLLAASGNAARSGERATSLVYTMACAPIQRSPKPDFFTGAAREVGRRH